jgi:hypothetical protein
VFASPDRALSKAHGEKRTADPSLALGMTEKMTGAESEWLWRPMHLPARGDWMKATQYGISI